MLTDLKAKSVQRRYVTAFSAALVGLLGRVALTPVIGNERFPFAFSLIAIVYCAFACGAGPSTAAAIFSILAV